MELIVCQIHGCDTGTLKKNSDTLHVTGEISVKYLLIYLYCTKKIEINIYFLEAQKLISRPKSTCKVDSSYTGSQQNMNKWRSVYEISIQYILRYLCCSKHNEINLNFLDEQNILSIEYTVNRICDSNTGPHKSIQVCYKVQEGMD